MVNKKRNIITKANGASAALVAGIDGCRGGWLALTLGHQGTVPRVEIAPAWTALGLDGHAMLAVDMPIGLTESGPRACDIAARRLLPRGRKSSVFPPPRRAMLACATWAEANAMGKSKEGKGLSHQAWNLVPKIRELDAALTPTMQDWVREAHPELIFQRLHGADPLPSKKTPSGRAVRLALLERAGIEGLASLIQTLPSGLAQADDLLDAAACALAAREIVAGAATCLPADPPRDNRGLRMEIWF